MAIKKKPARKKGKMPSELLERFKSKAAKGKSDSSDVAAKRKEREAKREERISKRAEIKKERVAKLKTARKATKTKTRTGGTATTTTKTGPRPPQPKPSKKTSPKSKTDRRKGISGNIIRCGGRGGRGSKK